MSALSSSVPLHAAVAERIMQELPFAPTSHQAEAIARLGHFLTDAHERTAFVLRGYAGTGKTTVVAALVKALRKMGRPPVLLAPTGRAAKVMASYAGTTAHTIHRMIYQQKQFDGEASAFEIRRNTLRHTLFIVDEASMIANDALGLSAFGSGRLMDDLVEHVYNQDGCRLLVVGDEAQLPPVGEDYSPALDIDYVSGFGLNTYHADLHEVVRQAQHSDILRNATRLRKWLNKAKTKAIDAPYKPTFRADDNDGRSDVSLLRGSELVEELEHCYFRQQQEGLEIADTIVITRSNSRAIRINNGIRAQIFERESLLSRGDLLMITKNNYHWSEVAQRTLPPEARPPFAFIANGDLVRVERIERIYELYGFQFAEVSLQFPDYNDYELDTVILLDALQAEAPALTREQANRLYESVAEDYSDIPTKRERMKKIREDRHYNALQVKYAYAVTCHKAQGGQWANVIVDQGYITEEQMDEGYLRWLYTAVTRAQKHLYLLNWPEGQTEEAPRHR